MEFFQKKECYILMCGSSRTHKHTHTENMFPWVWLVPGNTARDHSSCQWWVPPEAKRKPSQTPLQETWGAQPKGGLGLLSIASDLTQHQAESGKPHPAQPKAGHGRAQVCFCWVTLLQEWFGSTLENWELMENKQQRPNGYCVAAATVWHGNQTRIHRMGWKGKEDKIRS